MKTKKEILSTINDLEIMYSIKKENIDNFIFGDNPKEWQESVYSLVRIKTKIDTLKWVL